MKSNFFNLILALIITVIVVIGYGFWYAIIVNKSAAVAGLRDQIATKTEEASRIASARAALSEITEAQTTIQGYFVSETGIVSFIDDLETHAKSLGATINVLSVSAGSVDAHPAFTFALTIQGTFDSVMRTVGVIEYAPYDLSISNFSLVQGEKNIWNANFNLIVGSLKVATSTKP